MPKLKDELTEYQKEATIHFRADNKRPVEGIVEFGPTSHITGGNLLISVRYNGDGKVISRKYALHTNGNDYFSDLYCFIIDGEMFSLSEFPNLRLETETRVKNINKF